LISFTGSTAVG
jgi:aldehyde dehydrogenase family 7 protein A1